jgi:fructoselysine-6-P-deglycase FrlB-like protein
MEEEIWSQEEDIPRFASQIRRSRFSKLEPSTLIFTGSGDSYAAATFAQELSSGQAVALDPYELLRKITRVRGRNLIIVSVSGKTRANIELARRAKKFARKSVAITANPDSPLAQECDETFPLQYRKAGMLTSGTTSFTSTLIVCAFLLGQLPKTINVKAALTTPPRWMTRRVSFEPGSFLFTGSGLNYALSIYGAAKIREVLGIKAEADYPEQFGHARLFTIDKKRDIIICISSGRDYARRVHDLLVKRGFLTRLLAVPDDKVVQTSLKVAIHLQQLALALAKKRGMRECAFLADSGTLKLSNKMIY